MITAVLFVTGTDTSCGKTVVASLLISSLVRRGLSVGAVKPVETGCALGASGELLARDGLLLHRVANVNQTIEEVVPRLFCSSVAPSVASELEGIVLKPNELKQFILAQAKRCSILVVEGAGGLLVPISKRYTFADLAADCGMPLLIVVGSKLGAINHAALTFEVSKARGLETVGYVLNDVLSLADSASVEQKDALATNRKTLAEIGEHYEIEEICHLLHSGFISPQCPIDEQLLAKSVDVLADRVLDYFNLG